MKRYLIAGLLVWVPLGITIWVLHCAGDDARPDAAARCRRRCGPRRCSASTSPASASLLALPDPARHRRHRRQLLRPAADPGLGSRCSAASRSSSRSTRRSSRSATRCCPITGNAFRKALLVEFPRPGSWTIAFLTGTPRRRGRRPSCRRARQRLRADDAESDRRLLRDGAERARARARHDRRRGAQVHHLDGRRRAARAVAPRQPRRAAPLAAPPSPTPPRIPKLTGQRAPRPRASRAARPPARPDFRHTPTATPLPENALKRTDYCGRIDRRHLAQTVTLIGWVHRRRDHGGVIFIDLRDREGLVQVVCDPDRAGDVRRRPRTLRNEFVHPRHRPRAAAARRHASTRTSSPARSRCSRTRSRSSTRR